MAFKEVREFRDAPAEMNAGATYRCGVCYKVIRYASSAHSVHERNRETICAQRTGGKGERGPLHLVERWRGDQESCWLCGSSTASVLLARTNLTMADRRNEECAILLGLQLCCWGRLCYAEAAVPGSA